MGALTRPLPPTEPNAIIAAIDVTQPQEVAQVAQNGKPPATARPCKRATKASECMLCRCPIAADDEIWPLTDEQLSLALTQIPAFADPELAAEIDRAREKKMQNGARGSGKLRWVHLDCAEEILCKVGLDVGNANVAGERTLYATMADVPRPPCPHYERTGRCLHGDEHCFLAHEPRAAPREEDLHRVKVNDRSDGGPHRVVDPEIIADDATVFCEPVAFAAPPAPVATTFGKTARVGVLRRWLLEHIIAPMRNSLRLAAHSGEEEDPISVLDVAGGKGELAFELAYLNGMNCTIIDPRETEIQPYLAKRARGGYHCNPWLLPYVNVPLEVELKQNGEGGSEDRFRDANLARANASILARRGGGRNRDEPVESRVRNRQTPGQLRHLRLFFDHDLVKVVDGATTPEFDTFLENARRRVAEEVLIGESTKKQAYKKIRGGKLVKVELVEERESTKITNPAASTVLRLTETRNTEINNRDHHEEPPALITDAAAVAATLHKANLVVGMHLDGAAEAVVDFALQRQISFAIVPCCTCSKMFPNRRHPETGKLIKSYTDLVDYLQRKDAGIRKSNLDFSGKNVVLWKLFPHLTVEKN
eukprot:g3618.t1